MFLKGASVEAVDKFMQRVEKRKRQREEMKKNGNE